MAELVVTRSVRTCRCGYTKDHEMVAQEPQYSFWGWILLAVLGISAKPDHIAFRCTKCGAKLATSRDKALIERQIHKGAK